MPGVDPRGRPPSRPFYPFGQERLLQRLRAFSAGDRRMKFPSDARKGWPVWPTMSLAPVCSVLRNNGQPLFAYRRAVI